jgi:hypothetical protein
MLSSGFVAAQAEPAITVTLESNISAANTPTEQIWKLVLISVLVITTAIVLLRICFFFTPATPDNEIHYTPIVIVTAKRSTSENYSEKNISLIQAGEKFQLKFDVSIKPTGCFNKFRKIPIKFWVKTPNAKDVICTHAQSLGKISIELTQMAHCFCYTVSSRLKQISEVLTVEWKKSEKADKTIQFTIEFDLPVHLTYIKTISLGDSNALGKIG